MHLTPYERNRLKTLRAWHRRPPTWGALLPKAFVLVAIWCVLIVGFAIFVEGVGSPLMYYCIGLVTVFPILGLNLVIATIRRWRINEAIINWNRVEELLSTADRPGV